MRWSARGGRMALSVRSATTAPAAVFERGDQLYLEWTACARQASLVSGTLFQSRHRTQRHRTGHPRFHDRRRFTTVSRLIIVVWIAADAHPQSGVVQSSTKHLASAKRRFRVDRLGRQQERTPRKPMPRWAPQASEWVFSVLLRCGSVDQFLAHACPRTQSSTCNPTMR